MSYVARGSGRYFFVMRGDWRLWLAPLLLSSVVTGGGSFALLALFTDLSLAVVIAVSAALILVGDIALAFIMQAVSPTRVTLGPGDRRHKAEIPGELGTVATSFRNRHGRVSVRGEIWQARQALGCTGPLKAGGEVRIVERDGLTLIVSRASDG